MYKMRFYLDISTEQYLAYYNGAARFVSVQAEDGRRLQFPASELQKFVGHSGIQGRFEIEFNEQNKLQGLSRLS